MRCRVEEDALDLVAVFLRWTRCRAVLHNGWWLVVSVYLVVDAELLPAQLVLIGTAQAVTGLVFEVPAGVLADTISRRWSLVVSHVLMGTAMLTTGLVTDFGVLVATQMLWGLSWCFASGADVAWITDELADPARMPAVLARYGRAQLAGAAGGIVGFGALGSVIPRSATIVLAGTAMLLLGGYVALRFREARFVPTPTRRLVRSWAILARGLALVGGSRAIVLMFASTFLVHGAADAFGRLHPQRLIDLGFPAQPLIYFTGLGVLTLVLGAASLLAVEAHIEHERAALRGYSLSCAAGVLGLLALAAAPNAVAGSAGVLVAAGVALPLSRTIATIWVNQQTTDEVRATVHSLLAQAEYTGEIVCGLTVAAIAQLAGLPVALATCAGIFAGAGLLVRPIRTPRQRNPGSSAT